jgi:hypothetical protein
MANAAIYVKWGEPITGREAKGLEVFRHAMEFHARLQKEGKISAHHTFLATTGGTSQFGGCMILEGEIAQLRAVCDSAEWNTIFLSARHVVENVEVVHCIGGNEIPKFIEQTVSVRKQLGIPT